MSGLFAPPSPPVWVSLGSCALWMLEVGWWLVAGCWPGVATWQAWIMNCFMVLGQSPRTGMECPMTDTGGQSILKRYTCGPIIYLHCGGVTVRSCRSFVDRLSSERARQSRSCQQLCYQRQMDIPISCEFRWPNGSFDWLCKVGKLSGTPYICPCGWRFDMKPIMPDVVIERKAPSAL